MSKMPFSELAKPINEHRVRRIGAATFGFIPHRFLRDGFLSSLEEYELMLYVFLVLAANREGVSFYAYDRICNLLRFTPDAYLVARNRLLARDLIAFDGTRFQVLDLPPSVVSLRSLQLKTTEDFEEHDSTDVHAIIRSRFPSK